MGGSSRLVVLCGSSAPPDPRPDDVVVATTPAAAAAADAAGVPAASPQDLVPPLGLLPDPLAYNRWRQTWLAGLDVDLCQGTGAAVAAASLVAYPLDSLVTVARTMAALVEAVDPGAVVVVRDGQQPPPPGPAGLLGTNLHWRPWLYDLPLGAACLRSLAGASGLEFGEVVGAATPPRPARRLALRRWLAGQVLGVGRRRALAGAAHPSGAGAGGPVLFTWQHGYGFGVAAEEAGAAGLDVALLRRGRRPAVLVRRGGHFRRVGPCADLHPWTGVPAHDGTAPHLAAIDRWAGWPGAGSLFADRLRRYVYGVCAGVGAAAGPLGDALARARIGRVVSANPSSVEEFATLLAAARLGVQRILLRHGDDVFDNSGYLQIEPQNFDVVCVGEPDVADDWRRWGPVLGVTVPSTVWSSPRLTELRRSTAGTVPAGGGPGGRPGADGEGRTGQVFYVPFPYVGDLTLIGSGLLPDAWYFRWQQRLLGWMAGRPGRQFVWKALPIDPMPVDPLVALLRSGGGPPNVRLEERPFPQVAGSAACLVTDYASTALYEAAHLGIPALGLVFTPFTRTRPGLDPRVAALVRTCDGPDGALEHLESFVASHDGPAWRPLLPWPDRPWVDAG